MILRAYFAKYSNEFTKQFAELQGTPLGVAKKFGENTLKDIIIPFVKLNEWIDSGLVGGAKADELKLWRGKSDWEKSAPNLPSSDATDKSMEVFGGGKFVIPGSDKVPANIQDIRDALVNDGAIAKILSGASEINIGGTGVGGAIGTIGGVSYGGTTLRSGPGRQAGEGGGAPGRVIAPGASEGGTILRSGLWKASRQGCCTI